MINYAFIEQLFKNVFAKSKAFEGRFLITPNQGQELNSDDLGQVIDDYVSGNYQQKKFPIPVMLPPISFGSYRDKNGEWEEWSAEMLFLTPEYSSGTNQLKRPNPNTRTSTHTIIQDWHDMKRCAVNFIRVIRTVEKEKNLINDKFRMSQDNNDVKIFPVSGIGVSKLCGVKMSFSFSTFTGCTIEDYEAEDIIDIEVPASDPHPQHKL